MRLLPFKSSSLTSIGIELEFQLIDPVTFHLKSRAKDLIRSIKESPYQKSIKPEITQSMIEINSSVHHSIKDLYTEINDMKFFLLEKGKDLNIIFSGGGTHSFEKWSALKIFPTKRFKNLSRQYQYLSKRSTVFGQHVHIGCTNAEDALYLTHTLARYVPQFIALSASSPFYQGVDTGFHSSRSNVFNAFPMGGFIPYLMNWKEFSSYFYKMRNLAIIESMKDFYWDIRPKPEFGTVEIRVCDTPITIKKAIMLAAYIQAVSHYLLLEKPIAISQDLYLLYNYNRFQASRYGYDGEFINPYTLNKCKIGEDILSTINIIQKHTDQLNNTDWIINLMNDVINKDNDATKLRKIMQEVKTLPKLVFNQCVIWSNG